MSHGKSISCRRYHEVHVRCAPDLRFRRGRQIDPCGDLPPSFRLLDQSAGVPTPSMPSIPLSQCVVSLFRQSAPRKPMVACLFPLDIAIPVTLPWGRCEAWGILWSPPTLWKRGRSLYGLPIALQGRLPPAPTSWRCYGIVCGRTPNHGWPARHLFVSGARQPSPPKWLRQKQIFEVWRDLIRQSVRVGRQ